MQREIGPTFVYNIDPRHGRFLPFAELRAETLRDYKNFKGWPGLTDHVAKQLEDMGVTFITHGKEADSMDVREWCQSPEFVNWLLQEPSGVPDTVQKWIILHLLGKDNNVA